MLQGENLWPENLRRLPVEQRRKVNNTVERFVSKLAFSIIGKKTRPRMNIDAHFKKIRQEVINRQYGKAEVGLRYLRTSRIMLAQDYCADIYS